MGLACTDRGDPRLGHVRRRLEVGLADLEMDHVAARRLEGTGPGEDRERTLGTEAPDRLRALGRIAAVPIGPTYIVLDCGHDAPTDRRATEERPTAILVAAVAWSTAGLAQRGLDATPATQVAGRALFAFLALLVVVALTEDRASIASLRALGRDGARVAVFLASPPARSCWRSTTPRSQTSSFCRRPRR